MPQPKIDEELVRLLADMAARLDGGDAASDASLLDEFNRLAGTNIPFSEFQGIDSSEQHIDYVRRVLTDISTPALTDLGRDGLIEMFAKVLADPVTMPIFNMLYLRSPRRLATSRSRT